MAERKYILDAEGKPTDEVEGPDRGYIPWAARQGAIGIGETPGQFATLYGLAGAAKDYLYDRIDPTNPNATSFGDALLDPNGGKQKLDAYNQHVFNVLKESHPDEDDNKINERFEKVRKHSKKYYDDTSEFYRPGISFGRRWSRGTNELLGDPRLPSEKTQADDLMNIVGGAAIPVPSSTLAKVTGAGASKLGKVASNVAEVVTPATVIPTGATGGQIATRYGFNIGIPATINQAGRYFNDDPNIFKTREGLPTVSYTGETAKASIVGDTVEQAKKLAQTEEGIVALGAAGTIATILGAKRLKNIGKYVPQNPSGGPPSSVATGAISPEVNSLKMGSAQLGSDVQPLKVMAKEMGLDDAQIDVFMTKMNREAGSMPMADLNLWVNEKLRPLTERFVRDDPQFIEKYLQHVADRARVYGNGHAINEVTTELTKAQQDYQKALASGRSTPQRITQLQNQVRNLQDELQIRMSDSDPNLRSHSQDTPIADVRARLQQSSRDPAIRALEAEQVKLYDDWIDVLGNSRIISPNKVQSMKAEIRKGNYSLSENPLSQKSWLAGQKDKWLSKVDNHLIHATPEDSLGLYRAVKNEDFRKGYVDPATGKTKYVRPSATDVPKAKVNNPIDPFNELQFLYLRARQAAADNKMKREYVEMMMNAPRNAGKRYLNIIDRIPESKVPYNLAETIGKHELGKGHKFIDSYFDRGELVIFGHNERVIHDLLKFAPTSIVPIMNGVRKLTQTVVTGALNPDWAKTGVPWDIMMGAWLRRPDMISGPIQGLLANTFGRVNPITKWGGALSSGPDALIDGLTRLPYTAVKAIASEIFGNQLAKRWEVQLATNSGVFGQMAQIPGMRPVLTKIAQGMSQAYDASWTHFTKQMKVGHVSGYSDEILSHLKEVNDLSKKLPYHKAAWNTYKSILTVLHDVPKQMMLTQNVKLYRRELAKGKRQAIQMSEDYIADQARMIGGDMARISGNARVQRIMSTIPYGNVAQQSLRYMIQRMGENFFMHSTRLFSLGTVAAWGYYNLMMDEKNADEFFNQMPNDKRMEILPIPKPLNWAKRMAGLNVPRGSLEEEYFLIRMPPEMMLFMFPVVHGMMATGLIDSKKAIVPPTLKQDFKHAFDAVFGLSTPPLIQAAAATQGKRVEPGKLVTGGEVFRDIRDFSFSGANKDKMSPQSRIPHVYHDVFNALFGTVAGTLFEAANYGDIVYQRSGSLFEGIKKGVEKAGIERASKSPRTGYDTGISNVLWGDTNRKYVYTPYRQKYQEEMAVLTRVNEQMRNEPGLRRALQDNPRLNTVEKVGAEDETVVGPPISDPDVAAIVANNYKAFFSGPFKKLEEQRKLERRKHEAMTVGVSKIDPTQSPLIRFKAAQEQAKKVSRLDLEIYNLYQDIQKDIRSSPSGQAFEQKFGPLTPENLLKAVQATTRGQ